MSVTKKKRQHRVSKGIHGATKHPLTIVQRVLAGKGLVESIKHVECKTPYRGEQNPRQPVYNAAQVEENKRLYPHLFAPERKR